MIEIDINDFNQRLQKYCTTLQANLYAWELPDDEFKRLCYLVALEQFSNVKVTNGNEILFYL